MRILFCTGNQGKFDEAVHAFDHLSGGGVSGGRVTVRRHMRRKRSCPLAAERPRGAQVTRCDADPEEIQARDRCAAARALCCAAQR